MLDRMVETTPPCGAPLSVAFHRQSSKYPTDSSFCISRRNRPSWIVSDRIAIMTHRVDDPLDFLHGHAVRGFLCRPRGHRSVVGVDTTVGQQIQLRVEQ